MKDLTLSSQSRHVSHLERPERPGQKFAEPRIGVLVFFGLLVMTAFFGGTAYWAHQAKLDGAVVAKASFVVDGNRKTVQHLDGGIVRNLLVTDGDFVEAGQPLVVFDSTEADVDLTVLSSQIGELAARRARLLAQISQADMFRRSDVAVLIGDSVPEVLWESSYLTQKRVFETEARARASEKTVLDRRITALEDQIRGLEEQRQSNARQTQISNGELETLQPLFEKGLVTAVRMNSIRLDIERLVGLDAGLRTDQARARNEIGELELNAFSAEQQRLESVSENLAAVEAQMAAVEPQFRGAVERQKRVVVNAPVSGTVVNMALHTLGGVVRPGEDILELVPQNEELIVEARINTSDIEKLWIGQPSRVRLSGFDLEEVPEANGKVYDVSADAVTDEKTGNAFYVAKVRLDAQQPSGVAGLDLVPGMPADLFITTGERTVLSYLAQPLSNRLVRTFTE
ncbi:HlyD family type I secretion periplasmic adaptor subunit [Roseibium sp.]|uniref:HlyD family type I secretion periplasmic adaptor subunit n=1 Tax=Roseibium sp. TaxID=1936156 RepID=UPI003BAB7957